MEFKKFILENKKAIAALAKQNAEYDDKGNALLSKEEAEEVCWDRYYKEREVNHE